MWYFSVPGPLGGAVIGYMLWRVGAPPSAPSRVHGSARFATEREVAASLGGADGLGGVLAVLGQADRPVSYLTTGQAVPDDIEPADRRRLARLILGHEVVS